jgi:hypothetical protein
LRKERLEFQKKRELIVTPNKGVFLTKYNQINNEEAKKLAVVDNQKDY